MGASIRVNGKEIGQIADQYRRYTYRLAGLKATNTLEVVFDPSIMCGGRWMACTGGWDWAPYTNTAQARIPTFSKGIWKHVYIADVLHAAITHIVPQIKYAGEYPTTRLVDGSHGGFDVDVRLHIWAPTTTLADVGITGSWTKTGKTKQVQIPAGDSSVTLSMKASAADIKLWWPAGSGAQPLYNITATLSSHGGEALSGTRRVGFRMFALVTGNDTNPEYVKAHASTDGTDDMGMLWRVNGAVIWSKGANQIPMEELEGRMSADAHVQMVKMAVAGGMNTLRVWGGGTPCYYLFMPHFFRKIS